jgi:hypothetical protein
MHRRKNNPSTVTKMPRASASGGIRATANSADVVTTAAVIAGTHAEVAAAELEAVHVAMIAARAVTVTAVFKAMARVRGTDAIRGLVISLNRRKACAFRSLPQWKRCISW